MTERQPTQFNLLSHFSGAMVQAHRPADIERAREILVGALKDSLGSTGAPQQEEAGKVLALEVLFFEGVDKDGVFLAEDGQGAVVFYDINDHRWSWSNARRKANW